MFGRGKSVGQAWRVQPPQRSPLAQHPSETISFISSEMTLVGKIICKGVIRVCGLIEGELNASNALIADGARIRGEIVAEELTVGGRVKGNIHALRVKLQGTAVVEGDIFHRSLSIEENAWFEGCSRPEATPPEQRSSIETENSNPQAQALVALDDQGQFRSKPNEEGPKQLGGSGMHVFLAACIAIIALGVTAYLILSAMQQPTALAYATRGVRIDSSWIGR